MAEFKISQNFIKKRALVEEIVRNANFTEDEMILDIGAGRGIITDVLASISKKVVAIEPDHHYVSMMRQRFATFPLEVVEQDFMDYELPDTPFSVFSNIPFNRTADILKKLMSAGSKMQRGYIFLQEEAVMKFAGEQMDCPNTMVSVINGVNYEFTIVHRFDKYDFEPVPKVNIVLLEILRRSDPMVPAEKYREFCDFVAYIFSKSVPALSDCHKLIYREQLTRFQASLHVNPGAKPSQISLAQYVGMFNVLVKMKLFKLVNGYYLKVLSDQARIQKSHRTRIDPKWKSS